MNDEIVHTTAKDSLHGYLQWRNSLVALPLGTILEFTKDYTEGCYVSSFIKKGQCFKILKVRDSFRSAKDKKIADQVYEMVLCNSKSGKIFKRKIDWYVESVAKKIHDGEIKILGDIPL